MKVKKDRLPWTRNGFNVTFVGYKRGTRRQSRLHVAFGPRREGGYRFVQRLPCVLSCEPHVRSG